MDDKGFAGLYVGYNYDDLTYRIYDIERKIVVNSRDVKFFDDVVVKTKSDEQLMVTEEVEEDQFELEDLIHHNYEEDDEDELLYHYSPTTTSTIPTTPLNDNNDERVITGVRIEPIAPTIVPLITKQVSTRPGATNTRSTHTLNAIEGVGVFNPPSVCTAPSLFDDNLVTFDTHSLMTPDEVKKKLNLIANYITQDHADAAAVNEVITMLSSISPKGERLGFVGELCNTPLPVCVNPTIIDRG
jgi:hypothetical protein